MAEKKKAAKEKPFEKMTAKELRQVALEIPEIAGVHAMNKPELISSIRKAKGIVEKEAPKADSTVREVKQKIRSLKGKRQEALEASNLKMATIYRRRISRLKKKTRRAA